ncbi:hypothetical protein NC797_17900 [Aquibacillus sp. 3ASR75-11]|uniref:C4-dicarboxylate ABC transporter n=1 Tax=Terrihalobacillus insolitus TaxID=2950438 RepID=A0A9X3WUW6_9BACI|nr:hypothetical protein [Terrihalobacillus insolitus]MDC3414515.1 hypothetical protein [Terrihalobacillus insolitus]MDC3426342.1 hypothetical protein [Terrihalobacillus insolitus]
MNDVTGKWLGWLGILSAVIGFFVIPIWLGSLGVILGLIGLASPQKTLAWWAVGLSIVTFIIPYLS